MLGRYYFVFVALWRFRNVKRQKRLTWTKEVHVMVSHVICFLLGTVLPLATVGWIISH